MLGIGIGAMITPTVAQTLIARFGWRAAYSFFGALILLICWPIVAWLVKECPEDLGLLADGRSATPDRIQEAGHGLTAREAWRSRDFWLMACAFTLVSGSVQACVVHMAPMLNDRYLGTRAAALSSSLIGGAVMIGRLGTGYFLDRILAARLASTLFAVSALGNRAAFGRKSRSGSRRCIPCWPGPGRGSRPDSLPRQPVLRAARLRQSVQFSVRCLCTCRCGRSSGHGCGF